MHNSITLTSSSWQNTKEIAVKLVGAVYFGGIYGLILVAVTQLFLLLSQGL
ncbi:hypothetical protein [Magnetococcus marinus]|uniref:hypothetical protein n=1 Tax=Magnetococcus marinus TaxID=1124597 RepID=UPI00003C55F4|nr:hypothetical protein [Magnetococcus marinus]